MTSRQRIRYLRTPDGVPLAWADACLALLAQPERARELGAQARRRVLRDFSSTRVAEDVAALYHRLAV